MVLMTIDHASSAYNRGRIFSDSFFMWKPGSELPPAQFLTRWITHLCAPTFVFLAGVSLAIAVERRRARGEPARAIDRYIVSRGLVILALEIVWMSWVMLDPGRVLLQVLYAIGLSLVCMAGLRRLSDRALVILAAVILAGGEAALGGLDALGLARALPTALLLVAGFFFDRHLIVAYPLLPWLAIMMLGWVLGRRLVVWQRSPDPRDHDRAPRVLAIAGAASLAAFVVLRGIDGYGNMLLHREDATLVQWLHVSKYPPSLTYTTLELGLAALLLSALFVIAKRRPSFGGPVRLIGQVALFYYLLHIHLLHLAGWVFGIREKLGLGATYLGALFVLVALYPACRWYRAYKAAHPAGLARFI